MRLTAVACAALVMLALAVPAQAQIRVESLGLTISPAVSAASDYLTRGVSQTSRRAAFSGTIDVAHDSGFYIGAFAGNVLYGTASQETDVLGGYRFKLSDFSFDVGAVGYLYPGTHSSSYSPYSYYYMEFALKATYAIDDKNSVQLFEYLSPDYQFQAGFSSYTEFGVNFALPFDITFAGRIGYQTFDRNARIGLPDYVNWSLAVSHTIIDGLTASVGYYDTNVSDRRCGGGTPYCGAVALGSVTYAF